MSNAPKRKRKNDEKRKNAPLAVPLSAILTLVIMGVAGALFWFTAEPTVRIMPTPLLLTPQEEARTAREQGIRYYNAGRFAAAVQELTTHLDTAPNDADALALRANAYLRMGDATYAMQDLTRLAQIAPERPDIWYQFAQVISAEYPNDPTMLDTAQNFSELAIRLIEQDDALPPATYYRLLGDIHYMANDLTAARTAYEQYLALETPALRSSAIVERVESLR